MSCSLRGRNHIFTKVSAATVKFLQEAESAGIERVYWPMQISYKHRAWNVSNPLAELRGSLKSLELVPTNPD